MKRLMKFLSQLLTFSFVCKNSFDCNEFWEGTNFDHFLFKTNKRETLLFKRIKRPSRHSQKPSVFFCFADFPFYTKNSHSTFLA